MKYRLTLLGASSDSAWWRVDFEATDDDDALYQTDALLDHEVRNAYIEYEGWQLTEVDTGRAVGEAGQYGD